MEEGSIVKTTATISPTTTVPSYPSPIMLRRPCPSYHQTDSHQKDTGDYKGGDNDCGDYVKVHAAAAGSSNTTATTTRRTNGEAKNVAFHSAQRLWIVHMDKELCLTGTSWRSTIGSLQEEKVLAHVLAGATVVLCNWEFPTPWVQFKQIEWITGANAVDEASVLRGVRIGGKDLERQQCWFAFACLFLSFYPVLRFWR